MFPDDGTLWNDLLKAADQRMYDGKRRRRKHIFV
ncbi:GGDEF domain-containing protein [Paenibacillus sp. TRM 82003]|nr:GGDEF domain-containing protein [Paenibacillus sp. TRM 82003]